MEDSDSSFSLSCLLCKESEVCFNEEDDNEEDEEDDLFINLDDEYIKMLIEREKDNSFRLNRNGGSSSSSLDVSMMITQDWFKCARLDAIKWILKTRGFFGFRFQTAYLSMTYFDRFLSERPIDGEKIWAIRLLSVACLSLAAKMEECRVPTLSEFQIEEYNFESKVIQRMELLVLNTLEWRMDSITPFVYLHYFIIKLNDEVSPPPKDLASISTQLVLAIIREMNLMDHPPSAIAAAAVLAASNKRLTRKMVELKIGLISSFGSIQNEHVFSCYKLMQVVEIEKTSKIPKFVISPDLSSIYSTTSMDVHEEEDSLSSPTRTKKRRLNEYDQNCGMLNERRLH